MVKANLPIGQDRTIPTTITEAHHEGWVQGIVWAAGTLAACHFEGDYALDLLKSADLTKNDLSRAINYDLDQCRIDCECAEYLKGIKGVD